MATTTRGMEVGKVVGACLDLKRIDELKRAGITFPKIARELSALAFSNIEDYVTVSEGGEVQAIPLDMVSKRKLKAVKKIREKTNISESKDGETIFKRSKLEYELYDKADTLKYCVKLLGEEPADKQDHTFIMSPELDDMVSAILENGKKAMELLMPGNGNGKKGGKK